ncbi:pilus assembly protein TadG-related protein [Salinarimonas soli]|uniref:Pilus assembly protein n=1 Tax=Salinarimonas soli TaxID=1638099 RepID=A0A5B2VE82_9HYPH|nr:Tad domain-containing protein [Salinarimonas soli]KAA2236669.1 pilus assembly protein [Salinarimonas soli]
MILPRAATLAGRFRRDRGGGVALVLALALVPLVSAVAVAVDMSTWYNQRAKLQAVADGAALASARELRIASPTSQHISRVAEAYVLGAPALAGASRPAVAASVNAARNAVQVDLTAEVSPIFTRILTDQLQTVTVRAVARVSGSLPVCVVALERTQEKALHLDKSARITAERCAIYSNSSSAQGLRVDADAVMRAGLICSAGGRFGKGSSFEPQPLTDCPAMPDPLQGRQTPSAGSCAAGAPPRIVNTNETLAPGLYCGGLQITDGASVTLLSGVYVIANGPFRVDKGGRVTGRNTSFYFRGDAAVVDFRPESEISLTAMRDGALAGLLFFEDPTAPLDRDFRITSDNARLLLGTIYLPRGHLLVDAKRPVADLSAYTVIVARRLKLSDGPNLVLNTDYAATDIPVPKGVGPGTGQISLSQ